VKLLRLAAELPELLLLLKWTGLLAAGWLAHGFLRHRHPRWRIALWRSVWVGGVVLGLTYFAPIPGIRIPLAVHQNFGRLELDRFDRSASGGVPEVGGSTSADSSRRLSGVAAGPWVQEREALRRAKQISWRGVLVGVWGVGFLAGAVRLLRFQRQLTRLRRGSEAASAPMLEMAGEILWTWGGWRGPEIRVSDAIGAPFLFGIWRPVILLPRSFEKDLSESEKRALLSHELAHARSHDLFWSVGWRWMSTLAWFHPLVWGIPGAHQLACELEADRISAEKFESRGAYSQSLAALTLRILALRQTENRLAMGASSRVAQRLKILRQAQPPEWTRGHGVLVSVLAAAVVLVTGGCQLGAESKPSSQAGVGFALVEVVDETGQPIESATVVPFGLRVEDNEASAYAWAEEHEKLGRATTDPQGKAWVRYPLLAFPEEKQRTSQLILSVHHPLFCRAESQSHPVHGVAEPIRMMRGATIIVSGFSGTERKPVLELVPWLSDESIQPKDWEKNGDGAYVFRRLSSGERLVQLMGRLPSGEIVHSECHALTAEAGKETVLALELKPGIRLEGRLDTRVPRPVKGGRVLVSVRPKEYPATVVPEDIGKLYERFGVIRPWRTYRTIAEDGTFEFDSLPPGGEVDIVCHGIGFVSANGGTPMNRMPDGTLKSGVVIGVPQAFPIEAPTTRVEVVTEPTCTLEMTVTRRDGAPVSGARIVVSPNMMRLPGGIFGEMEHSSEEPLRRLDPLPELPYSASTDRDGRVVMPDLPSCTRGLGVEHADWVLPLDPSQHDRWVRFSLQPGEKELLRLTLVPKGTDFLGASR
jgi:beta-lactamase regulating signal transducer with metallopeptidase domain